MPNKSLNFYYKNQQIFMKMKSDMDWMINSPISNRYEFGTNDPFIIKPKVAYMKPIS